jgi:enoyl-CoA hydratase/carnithine racemase
MTRTTAAGPAIRTTVQGGVGTIEISNPARRNALSVSMMGEFATALQALGDDPAVRVVVLRGSGEEAFISGADISEFTGRTDDARRIADEAADRLFTRLSQVPVPVIARIHGYCLGAGVAVALGADLRCADTRGVLAIPAAKLGVGYPIAQTAALVQTVGYAAAGDLLYTGRRLPAAEALSLGLLDRVAQPERLGEVVDELAATIAGNAPLSVRAAKAAIQAVRRAGNGDPAADEIRRRATVDIGRCATSADLHEGAVAFLEKRPPRFTGR